MRDLCGIIREGVTFFDISYAAEKNGLCTVSVKATLNDLIHKIMLPCIIHWNDDHFIVVYQTIKNKIYVSDPAKGLLSYTPEKFIEKWYKKEAGYGSAMALEPMLILNR